MHTFTLYYSLYYLYFALLLFRPCLPAPNDYHPFPTFAPTNPFRMITIQVGKHELLLYASAEETPMLRYSRFQKFTLIESGVGADIDAIGNHFAKLFQFLQHGMAPEALEESKNLYYNQFLILQEINVPGMAFCCLVHSIDGKEFTDLTEDNLKKTVDLLSGMGITHETVKHYVEHLKKKSTTN